MSRLLPRLLPHAPAILRRQALSLVFRATAEAFRSVAPPLSGLAYEQRLLAYATLSAGWAEDALKHGEDLSQLQERLYANAYQLARLPGSLLRVRRMDDVMSFAHFLYASLGIEFEGSSDGAITIHRCYFSRFYSPDVCQLMSAMDRGLFAGLPGKGALVFTERITEGASCCRARFTLEAGR